MVTVPTWDWTPRAGPRPPGRKGRTRRATHVGLARLVLLWAGCSLVLAGAAAAAHADGQDDAPQDDQAREDVREARATAAQARQAADAAQQAADEARVIALEAKAVADDAAQTSVRTHLQLVRIASDLHEARAADHGMLLSLVSAAGVAFLVALLRLLAH